MQPQMNDPDTKGPNSKVDIVKEVASALEEEDFLRDEATSTSSTGKLSLSSSGTSATTSQQQPVKTTPLETKTLPSPVQSASVSSSSFLASPAQQKMRSLEPLESLKSSSTTSTSSSGTTWQDKKDTTTPTEEASSDDSGVWGWMSSAVTASLQTTQNIGRNLMEKTKSSVDTVITTLDPSMEDYLHDRGDAVKFLLTSEDADTIEAVRDGFRQIFELAFVESCSSTSSIAPLPIGCSAGLKGAQHRVSHLRRMKKVKEDKVIIGIEEMVAELVPGKWFSMICLHLSDPVLKADLQTFSQAMAIPKHYITKAEQSTPSNYNLRWSGLSFTLGEVILGAGNAQGDWQSQLGGSSRRQILTMAARTLAGQYRIKINETAESVMDKAVLM